MLVLDRDPRFGIRLWEAKTCALLWLPARLQSCWRSPVTTLFARSRSRYRRPSVPAPSASTRKRRVGEKADGRARRDRGGVLGELDQAVRLGQRSDDAGTVLRIFVSLDVAVGRAPQRHPHIFAPALALAVA